MDAQLKVIPEEPDKVTKKSLQRKQTQNKVGPKRRQTTVEEQ